MKLAAITACALVGLTVAQSVHSIPTTQVRLVGEIPAEWWTYVELEALNGAPVNSYTVPQGHYFVVTRTDYCGDVRANGQPVARILEVVDGGRAFAYNAAGDTRVSFSSGTILENYYSGNFTTRLWGYLEPVR